ncbi:MAG TPA: MgtC/SapB family protein [Anaeromyxobacter sp.]
MGPYELFASLGVAAAAGLLIGLERERSKSGERTEAFLGGARTHPLLALAGGVATLAAREVGPVAVAVPFGALVLLLGLSYAGEVWRDGHRGLTSEAAFILSFLLGALALTQDVIPSATHKLAAVAAVAVVATFLLSAKPMLHPMVRRISTEDLTATLEFLVIVVVALPLLPDRGYGPYAVLNPFQIGVLMVLISALSFAAYVAIRLLGARRGLGVTGLFGGLVSSTAVTLSMAGRARERPQIADSAALAVMLASTVMFARVLVIVTLVNPALRGHVALPMAGGIGGGLLATLFLWIRSGRATTHEETVALSNPFELGAAMKFALIFAVILVGSKAATELFGSAGTYAAGLLAGVTDVDAITLTVSKLAGDGGVAPDVAATTIFLGTASNTLAKGIMGAVVGGWSFGRRVLGAQLAVLAAGAVGAALAWL